MSSATEEIELVDMTPLAPGLSLINSPKLSNSDHIAAGLPAILASAVELWMMRPDGYEQ